jgi:hypothetical protein
MPTPTTTDPAHEADTVETAASASGGTLVPRDRNREAPFDRTDNEHPYPTFVTDPNKERLRERHVFRFPTWTTQIPEARSVDAVRAKVTHPAPTSKVEPFADGRILWDEEKRTEAAGRLAVLFGKSHEEENLSRMATSVRERSLQAVWEDARSVVEDIVTIRREYALLHMASRKLIRREEGERPESYLERLTKRYRSALEHYYRLRSSFQSLSGVLQDWEGAYCQMHDVSRFQLPSIRKGGYEIMLP